jgi:hypothetical protein
MNLLKLESQSPSDDNRYLSRAVQCGRCNKQQAQCRCCARASRCTSTSASWCSAATGCTVPQLVEVTVQVGLPFHLNDLANTKGGECMLWEAVQARTD